MGSYEITAFLSNHDKSCDSMIYSISQGNLSLPDINGEGHLNANKFIAHLKRMKKDNILKPDALVFATHISHEGNYNHKEFSDYAESSGYKVA
jgi:hypothetical protein